MKRLFLCVFLLASVQLFAQTPTFEFEYDGKSWYSTDGNKSNVESIGHCYFFIDDNYLVTVHLTQSNGKTYKVSFQLDTWSWGSGQVWLMDSHKFEGEFISFSAGYIRYDNSRTNVSLYCNNDMNRLGNYNSGRYAHFVDCSKNHSGIFSEEAQRNNQKRHEIAELEHEKNIIQKNLALNEREGRKPSVPHYSGD